MSETVHVLMSTFNGQAYLQSQVDSILQQTIPVKLFVRDDGSTDETPQLLEKLSLDRRVQWVRGRNIGATNSFFRLLRHQHANDAQCVAFADQDDVWLPSKLERAVEALSNVGERRAALYCSSAIITNERMEPIGLTPKWPRKPSFGNALVENIATGCTIVLNKPAVALIGEATPPKHALFHDWWCYLIASAFGNVIYDSEPSLYYRQHRNNAVGVDVSPWRRLLKKVERQIKQDTLASILAQAAEFSYRYHHVLSPRKAAILSNLLAGRDSLMARERLLFDRSIFRQYKQDDALLRLRFASGPWPGVAPADIRVEPQSTGPAAVQRSLKGSHPT